MKSLLRLIAVAIPVFLLAGCTSPQKESSKIQAAASQEVVQGAGRTRAKSHTDLGIEYYAQKQYGTALQEARTALKDDSTYAPTYNLLALIYMELKDEKLAEESFQHAFKLAPGDPEISNNYAYFLCRTKREKQAFQYFNTAIQNPLYSTPQRAMDNAADCAMQVRDYKGAEGYLSRALTVDPADARSLMLMSKLKYQQNNYVEARYYIAEAHRNAEPTAESAWLAFRIARQSGNRDDEARYRSLLRKKFPDSEEYKKLSLGVAE